MIDDVVYWHLNQQEHAIITSTVVPFQSSLIGQMEIEIVDFTQIEGTQDHFDATIILRGNALLFRRNDIDRVVCSSEQIRSNEVNLTFISKR